MLHRRPRKLKRSIQAMRRMVAWIAAAAMLSYVLTGEPVMLQMAAAQQSAGIPCADHHGHHSGGLPGCDHEHCLFCQGGVGPGVLAAAPSYSAPSFDNAPFALAEDSPFAIRHSNIGYASRAPPPAI
jgi:hypothetical protein